jgi:hypothetical protein
MADRWPRIADVAVRVEAARVQGSIERYHLAEYPACPVTEHGQRYRAVGVRRQLRYWTAGVTPLARQPSFEVRYWGLSAILLPSGDE